MTVGTVTGVTQVEVLREQRTRVWDIPSSKFETLALEETSAADCSFLDLQCEFREMFSQRAALSVVSLEVEAIRRLPYL